MGSARRTVAALAVCLAAAGCASPPTAQTPPTSPPTVTSSPAQSTRTAAAPPTPGPLVTPPPPAPSAHLTVDEVVFSNALDGWALGTRCVGDQQCTLLVDSTTSGGARWGPATTVGPVEPDASGNAWPATVHIRVQGSNIWVAGPGIYESHDAGRTWRHDYTAHVDAIEPGSSDAWAIGGCTTAQPNAPCVLLTSRIGSDSWTRAPSQPAFHGADGGATWQPVLERAPGGAAYIASTNTSSPGSVVMFGTRDDGRSWSSLTPPCAIGVVGLRSADGTTVWALCGGGGGAGSGPKAVYVSSDGGHSWQERANDTTTPPVGTLSNGGYAISLATAGPRTGLIGSLRAGILRSTDGGRTWRDVGSSRTCLLQGNGVTELWFVSSSTGWALEENDDGGTECPLLVRTTDGGATWAPEGSPLGWTPF